VVKLLLARDDVDPDKPDNNGQAPLWRASSYGHEGVVRLLLPRDDVNPDRLDNEGRTPLWVASRWGQEGAVKLLLARDHVNPNQLDNDGETPFCVASSNEHEGWRGYYSPDAPPIPINQTTIVQYHSRGTLATGWTAEIKHYRGSIH